MYTLRGPDIRDVFLGGKVLACGGGGEIEWAEPFVREMERRDLKVRIATVKELKTTDRVCVPGGIGAGSSPEARDRLKDVPQIAPADLLLPTMARAALEAFERQTKTRYNKLLAVNLGPVLWGLPLYLSAVKNRVCLDGDCAGRAIPEWTTTTLNVRKLSLTPSVIVSAYGDHVSITANQTNERTEQVGRAVAVECGGWCVMVTCATSGSRVKNAFVPGTIERAWMIGKAIRQARKDRKDPLPTCLEAAGGIPLFEGTVRSYDRTERGGFMFGEILIDGSGAHRGRTCRIYQKTEFNLAWVDDVVVATCPDSICVVDRRTAEGLTSFPDVDVGPYRRVRDVDFRHGREVVVFGIPAHPIWKSKRGVDLFGPKHFGFDIPYIPVDERARSATR
jgi:hypothetical protein